MFPAEWSKDVAFPMLEDLLMAAPFSPWPEECERKGEVGTCDVPPSFQAHSKTGEWYPFLGMQSGAMGSKRAAAEIVDGSRFMEEHFACAKELAGARSTPFDADFPFDDDLQFAARRTVHSRSRLRKRRFAAGKAVKELSRRLLTFSEALKRHQHPAARSVAGRAHVGLMAVLIVVFRWPDWTMPWRFITGFGAVGAAEWSGICRPQAARDL